MQICMDIFHNPFTYYNLDQKINSHFIRAGPLSFLRINLASEIFMENFQENVDKKCRTQATEEHFIFNKENCRRTWS